MSGLIGADGIHELVAFFDEVFAHGKGSLLLIPGATLFGVDKLVDNVLEANELFLFVHAVLLKSRLRAGDSEFGDIEIEGTGKSLEEIHERRQYLRLFDKIHGGEKAHGNVADEPRKKQALGKARKKPEEAVYAASEGGFKQIVENMCQKAHSKDARKEEQGHGEQGGEAGRNTVIGEYRGKACAKGAGKDNTCGNAKQAGHFLNKTTEKALDTEKEKDDEQYYIEDIDLEHSCASTDNGIGCAAIVEEWEALSRMGKCHAIHLLTGRKNYSL
jgi:hypothetical protein